MKIYSCTYRSVQSLLEGTSVTSPPSFLSTIALFCCGCKSGFNLVLEGDVVPVTMVKTGGGEDDELEVVGWAGSFESVTTGVGGSGRGVGRLSGWEWSHCSRMDPWEIGWDNCITICPGAEAGLVIGAASGHCCSCSGLCDGVVVWLFPLWNGASRVVGGVCDIVDGWDCSTRLGATVPVVHWTWCCWIWGTLVV